MYAHFKITDQDNQRRTDLDCPPWKDIVQAGLKALEDDKQKPPLSKALIEPPLREAIKNLSTIVDIMRNYPNA